MRDYEQPLDDHITFRAWSWLRRDVQKIGDNLLRDESEVARFLLVRGLAAFKRDGSLIEPEDKGRGRQGRK